MGTRPARLLALSTLLSLASACTVTSMGAENGPPRVESNGLIEGHAAVGFREEDQILEVKLFDGESDGSLGEIVLWKLLRLEVGALGVGIGVGPFDLALGTLWYEPDVPAMIGADEAHASTPAAPVEECAICREAASAPQD